MAQKMVRPEERRVQNMIIELFSKFDGSAYFKGAGSK
jgi:hypothetical protein